MPNKLNKKLTHPRKRTRSQESPNASSNKRVKACVSPKPSNLGESSIKKEVTCDKEVIISLERCDDLVLNYSTTASKPSPSTSTSQAVASTSGISEEKVAVRCPTCLQFLKSDTLRLYEGHPENAVEEDVALTDSRLCVFTGLEKNVDKADCRPTNKVTHFAIYDKEGHLCRFDSGLVERNSLLYFSGYMKPIFDEDNDIKGGVPTYDMGPINEWSISGLDEGEKPTIFFSTAFGDYYLMAPSPSYAPLMEDVNTKIFITKTVLKYLLCNNNDNSYENLLSHITEIEVPEGVPKLDEHALLSNAQFICEELQSLIQPGAHESCNLILAPCIRHLINLTGVVFNSKRSLRAEHEEVTEKLACCNPVVSTTRKVKLIIENLGVQLNYTKHKVRDFVQCGKCDSCIRLDCGVGADGVNKGKKSSKSAKKKKSYKSANKSTRLAKRCPNIAIEEANNADKETVTAETLMTPSASVQVGKLPPRKSTWGSKLKETVEHIFYETLTLHDPKDKTEPMLIEPGNFVLLSCANSKEPGIIARVQNIGERKLGKSKFCHVQIFIRAAETILGETACANEIFQLEECQTVNISSILSKLSVHLVNVAEEWEKMEPPSFENPHPNNKTFWYQKGFVKELCRFVDIPVDGKDLTEYDQCGCCERKVTMKSAHGQVLQPLPQKINSQQVLYSGVKWCGELLRRESCILLSSTAFTVGYKKPTFGVVASLDPKERFSDDMIDEVTFPEYHRKETKGDDPSISSPQPYRIARIISIYTQKNKKQKNDIYLKVAKFYRPEDIKNATENVDQTSLFWTSEECEVNFDDIKGICWVRCINNLEIAPEEWHTQGPNRFYVNHAYNHVKQTILDLPEDALHFGETMNNTETDLEHPVLRDDPPPWPPISRPLRCFDIFAGCGGFSEGIRQSGAAVTEWAIDANLSATEAFSKHASSCMVMAGDVRSYLESILNNRNVVDGKELPGKKDVELLCGLLPSSEFQGTEEFDPDTYKVFKKSLVVTTLGYCDFLRPKYIILENSHSLLASKKGMVLKIIMRCLLAMGYQCTFGVLQADSFGVPQESSWAFIMAAAPGEFLPYFPEPTHTLKVKRTSDNGESHSAPLPAVTVHDAISDLPQINNGANNIQMGYTDKPQSNYQKFARQKCQVLTDHVCKAMNPLSLARISKIPTTAGSDWRDLPNSIVPLSDGTRTESLIYTQKVNGGRNAVCPCSIHGQECDLINYQSHTLIPWCLAHSANKHDNWPGLYGRVDSDSALEYLSTNPEPLSKKGRVVHPEENRLLSVRENARMQGFQDDFSFCGTMLEKYQQAGNSVPPPMAAAIGREIRRCVSLKENEPESYLFKGFTFFEGGPLWPTSPYIKEEKE